MTLKRNKKPLDLRDFKSALKIIQNDIDIAYELQNFRIEIRILNFFVGESVGEKSREVSRVFSKSLLVNLIHFDTNLVGAADCGEKLWIKTRLKIESYGGLIAWVQFFLDLEANQESSIQRQFEIDRCCDCIEDTLRMQQVNCWQK